MKPFSIPAFVATLVATITTPALAQYQTTLQVNQGLYPGGTTNPSSLRYGSQNPANNPLLPSENRYIIMKSALLPSQIRAGQLSAGPLAPGGVTTWVNPVSPLQQAVPAPTAPTGPLAVNTSAPLSSVHYATPAAAPNAVPPNTTNPPKTLVNNRPNPASENSPPLPTPPIDTYRPVPLPHYVATQPANAPPATRPAAPATQRDDYQH